MKKSAIYPIRFTLIFFCFLLLFPFSYIEARADNKTNEINIIVPSTAGGINDAVARIVADLLPEQLGRQIVVVNRPGAGTTIGAREVARAKPDGTTVLIASPETLILRELTDSSAPKLDEFRLVETIAGSHSILYASSKHGWNSLKDFIADAKKHPGKYSIGILPGTSYHLSAKQIQALAGISLVEVPFKGVAEIFANIAGGHLDLGFGNNYLELQDPKFKMLAIRSRERSPETPDLPTFKESGINTESFPVNFVVMVPRNTPNDIVDRLAQAIRTATAKPGFQKQMRSLGLSPATIPLKEYEKRLAADKAAYRTLVETYMPKTDAPKTDEPKGN